MGAFLLVAALLASLLSAQVLSFPFCLNNEAPLPLNTSLVFCSSFLQNDSSCCDASMDKQLQSSFEAYNVSDMQCAGYLKQLLCAQCDPYAGDLFQVQLKQEHSSPLLCNSTTGLNGTASNSTTGSYCNSIWDACKSVPIKNSPFATSLQGAAGSTPSVENASKLTDLWQSQSDFCSALGVPTGPGQFCFSGAKFLPFNSSTPPPSLEGICFEKIGEGVYLNLIPHPDGSNHAFVASQQGKIWLAALPAGDSNKNMTVSDEPFLDISERVVSTQEYGLLGLAFHPNFKDNGRFFVSYNCDKDLWPDCAGRCSCNAEAGCTLSELGSEAGAIPCQYSSVIAEYTVNTTASSPPFKATAANPNEVRRIFTMGLPYSTHHAGQILFGPIDNYLYLMMGDGGSTGDPFNFAQKKMSLLGKILRFDIDNLPTESEIQNSQLWGNYSIPPDNPFAHDNSSQPEVWAYGLRNPWRCSFDKTNPSYFYCADVGQEKFEEVDLMTKGGNYGWRTYEGDALYTAAWSPGGNTSASSIEPIFPILEYPHSGINPATDAASITGGFVSRSTQDACLYGRYVYGDLYGAAMWAAAETPLGSGNYITQRVNFSCSADSPMECKPSSTSAMFLYLFSFGEDNENNLYALSQMGVYKVSDPKGCGFTCNATLPASALVPLSPAITAPSPSPSPSPAPSAPTSSSGYACLPFEALRFVALAALSILMVCL